VGARFKSHFLSIAASEPTGDVITLNGLSYRRKKASMSFVKRRVAQGKEACAICVQKSSSLETYREHMRCYERDPSSIRFGGDVKHFLEKKKEERKTWTKREKFGEGRRWVRARLKTRFQIEISGRGGELFRRLISTCQ